MASLILWNSYNEQPHLVILEVQMPEKNGFQVFMSQKNMRY